MEKLFREYIKLDSKFTGNVFDFNLFLTIDSNPNIYDFISLRAWYSKEDSKDVIQSILKEYNIDIEKNIKEAKIRQKKFKKSLKTKMPTLESFIYYGPVHEH
jgi:hypothetical protein